MLRTFQAQELYSVWDKKPESWSSFSRYSLSSNESFIFFVQVEVNSNGYLPSREAAR